LSYSGVHKPSLLGRLIGLIGTVFTTLVIWWLVWTGFQDTKTTADLLWLIVGLIVSFAIAVFIHEAGHLLVGLAVGAPARKIRIGTGNTLLGLRVRGLVIQICTNPLSGGAVYFSELDSSSVGVRIASLAAGPGMNLLAAAYAIGLIHSGATWLEAFALANMATFVAAVVPATSVEGGRQHLSDGLQLLRLIIKPRTRSAYFEGAEMTPDAQAVLVHALEDAQIAGESEVTDEHIIRALNRDPVVGALFATADLDGRLPPGGTPQTSTDPPTPTWSVTAHAALEAAFRMARDMGLSKPNAAGICLGLLAVDCLGSRLLVDAGISEDAVRRLAASSPEVRDADRAPSFISPDLPLERWGTAADKTLAFAYRVATADGSSMVGTHHMVAALVADTQCRGARALTALGFVLVRHDHQAPSTADAADASSPKLSPHAAAAIAASLWRTGPSYPSGTGELCLGIVDQGQGIGAEMLASGGITVKAMEKQLRLVPRDSSEPAGCTAASWPMWQLRASARIGVGRWKEAREDFLVAERAATTDEQRAMCRNNAAWASLMSGEPALQAEALEMARAAMAFQPHRHAFVGTYAFALMESGSPAEAAALLEPVAATHPRPRDRASDLCLLAICQARLHKPEAAASNLEAARTADPRCLLLERAQAELAKESAPA
jgi:hypothetical protein